MSRFLFATVPIAGHTVPALPIAKELINRGHSVRWYGGAAFADRIRSIGASYHPMSGGDYSGVELDSSFPERKKKKGIRKLQFDMVYAFALPVRTQVRDLTALLEEQPADVVIGDTAFGAGPTRSELGGPPFAAFGISVVGFPSRDVPAFGFGLTPSRNPLSRVRNAAMAGFTRHFVFKPMNTAMNQIRSDLGLPPTSDIVFEYPLHSALYLQLGAESFEYPRSDLPSIVRYVGPPTPLPAPEWQPPEWWPELQSGRTVVLINQGTVATDSNELLRPSLDALASDDDLLVVAVTGGPNPDILAPLRANARVERFIPFGELLPHVDLFVTNGGFGGVQLALADGIPIVAAGRTEDKLEVNARIEYAGVGVDLKTQKPTPKQVRNAVRQVLTDDRFQRRARQLRDEIAAAGREHEAASLLEELAGHTSASGSDHLGADVG